MNPSPTGAGLLVLEWILTIISLIIVALRVLAKAKIRQFRPDDVLMIISLIFCISSAALDTVAVKHGYGYPSTNLSQDDATVIRKNYLFGEATIVVCAAVGRASFVTYLVGIIGRQKRHRVILIVLAIMEMMFNLVSILMMFLDCTPLEANWDYTIPGVCRLDTNEIQMNYDYFASSFNIFVDLYLAVVPTYIFWHLKLKVAIKLSLIALMSCGLVAMGAAIAKTAQLQDISYGILDGTISLVRWGFLEANLVIITASIPCLRSLILSGFHYMSSSGPHSQAYELGTAFTGTRRGTATVTAPDGSQRRAHSRLRDMLSSKNNANDGASGRHIILESRSSLDAVPSSEAVPEGRAAHGGIHKQVDVTVTMHDESPGED